MQLEEKLLLCNLHVISYVLHVKACLNMGSTWAQHASTWPQHGFNMPR